MTLQKKNCLQIVPYTHIFYENQVSDTDSFLILVLINFRKSKNVQKLTWSLMFL